MNRGFKIYFKEGLKALKGFLTKKTNLLSYYFYYYVFIFAKMCPFFAPLADLSRIKMTRMIRDEHQISITRSFYASNSPKNYWTLFVSGLLKGFIISAVFAVLFAAGVILALAGTGIGFLLDIDYWFIIPIILVLPVLGYSAYVSIILPFRHVPNAYIVDFNNNLGASEVVHASFSAMKERGKVTLFVSYVVESILADAYFILTVAVLGGTLLLFNESDYLINILVFEGVFLVLGLLLYAPLVNIIFSVYRLSLFEDLCAAHITGPVKVTGVNLKRVNVTDKEVTVNEMLEDLFDAEIVEDRKNGAKPKTNAVNRVEAFNRTMTTTKPAVKEETQKDVKVENVVKPVKAKEVKVEKAAKPVVTKEVKVSEKPQAKPTPVVKTTVKSTSQVVRTTAKKTPTPVSKPTIDIFGSLDPIAPMKPLDAPLTPTSNESLIDNKAADINLFGQGSTKEDILVTPANLDAIDTTPLVTENNEVTEEPVLEEVVEVTPEELVSEETPAIDIQEETLEIVEAVDEQTPIVEEVMETIEDESVLEEVVEVTPEELVSEETPAIDIQEENPEIIETVDEETPIVEEAMETIEDEPVLEEVDSNFEDEAFQEAPVNEETLESEENLEEDLVVEEVVDSLLDEQAQEDVLSIFEEETFQEEPVSEENLEVVEEIALEETPVLEEANVISNPFKEDVVDVFSTNSTSSNLTDVFGSPSTNSNQIDMGFGSGISDDIFGMGTVNQPKTTHVKGKPIIVKTVKKN